MAPRRRAQFQENDTGDVWASSSRLTTTISPQTGRYAPASEGGAPTTIGLYNNFQNAKHGRMSEIEGWNSVDVILRGNTAVHVVNGHVNMRVTDIRQWDTVLSDWVRLDNGRISIQAEAAETYSAISMCGWCAWKIRGNSACAALGA